MYEQSNDSEIWGKYMALGLFIVIDVITSKQSYV